MSLFQKKHHEIGIIDKTVFLNQAEVKIIENTEMTISIATDIKSYTERIQSIEKVLKEKVSDDVNDFVLLVLNSIG